MGKLLYSDSFSANFTDIWSFNLLIMICFFYPLSFLMNQNETCTTKKAGKGYTALVISTSAVYFLNLFLLKKN